MDSHTVTLGDDKFLLNYSGNIVIAPISIILIFTLMNNLAKILIGAGTAAAALFTFNKYQLKIPKGAEAVRNFNVSKYLGQWYEIARFDYRFEKHLKNVTATYSKNGDGTIRVQNRGFHIKENKWKESIGTADFIDRKDEARIKVSFFKPMWSSYNVIDLVDYKYALVAGNSTDYLWILSREKTIPDYVKDRFLAKAESLNFKTENLIWVEHD